jgi:hypothetical protein
MSVGPVPVNQLNALPLFSASEFAFGGTVSVIGGAINRYFSPAQTGINGTLMNVTDTDPSGAPGASPYIISSGLLDVRGCTRFTALLACRMTLKAQELNGAVDYSYGPMNLRIMSPAASDVGTVPPRTGNYGLTAWPYVGGTTLRYTGEAGDALRYKSGAIGWMVGGTWPASVQTGSLGFIYLWFNFPNAANDKTAQIYVSLYATS